MHKILTALCIILAAGACWPLPASAGSNRRERRLITEGNGLYRQSKFVEAASVYEEALVQNPESAEALYNLGLSQIRQVANPVDTAGQSKALIDKAVGNLGRVAEMARTKPSLAEKANYNLGNLAFNQKDYDKAIERYKQALRIDPNDDKARKNLRIAQLNRQKNDRDKNQDKNQDRQEQQQQQQQQQPPEQHQQPPRENDVNEQTAARILQAVDNKENQTRARVNKANTGEKSRGAAGSSRRW